jgi:hypothetical protein
MRSARQIAELPRTPGAHFRLHVYGALLRLRARLPLPDDSNGLGFLCGYYDELAIAGFAVPDPEEHARWATLVRDWEQATDGHLPLRAVRETARLGPLATDLLVTAGLVDEDARFGGLFEAMNGLGAEPRPTLGLLATWTDDDAARDALHDLLDCGLLETPDPALPRSRWPLEVPSPLWDALRGRGRGLAPWGRHTSVGELPAIDQLILPAELRTAVARARELLSSSDPRPLLVRGPRASGRRTIVGAIARSLGRGLLELRDAEAAAVLGGLLATALHALPLLELRPGAGEAVELPPLTGFAGPRAAIAPRRGAVRAARALTLEVEIPNPDTRAAHWEAAVGPGELARTLATSVRATSGMIRRLGDLAGAEAALAGRHRPSAEDVRRAQRTLEVDALETLATRVPVGGDWHEIAVGTETAHELALLESRCRNRERLAGVVSGALAAQLTPGVRALFSGPSGTGKTLAVRLLASVLGKELYSLDLASVVNKYLGETEKNLDAVFSRAEELDVVLLLDEGDALMTRRTEVSTSNDRYANLETNFLLARLESYEGILVVTTNAGERIDPAFRRRLDLVVDFCAPDATERIAIWEIHLPESHEVPAPLLDELAVRCPLTGGQIRNAVLHASLLALDAGEQVCSDHVVAAVRREYRKVGGVCPLRAEVIAVG